MYLVGSQNHHSTILILFVSWKNTDSKGDINLVVWLIGKTTTRRWFSFALINTLSNG